jgi:hypothetical protein
MARKHQIRNLEIPDSLVSLAPRNDHGQMMTLRIAAYPAGKFLPAMTISVLACAGIAIAFYGSSASAVEQCRFIQAKGEREACYQRQESELAAKRKRAEAPRRDKTMESLEQMKHEDEALDRQIHGICRGC